MKLYLCSHGLKEIDYSQFTIRSAPKKAKCIQCLAENHPSNPVYELIKISELDPKGDKDERD